VLFFSAKVGQYSGVKVLFFRASSTVAGPARTYQSAGD
jgi:hypothetical protein